MAGLKLVEKARQLGSRANSKLWSRVVGVTREADSYRKKIPTPRFKFKGKYGGDVVWIVQSELNPVPFAKLKDAKTFQEILLTSQLKLKSDIVRHEVDKDSGYELT